MSAYVNKKCHCQNKRIHVCLFYFKTVYWPSPIHGAVCESRLFPGYKKLSHCFFPPKLLVPAEEESESCGRVQENKM